MEIMVLGITGPLFIMLGWYFAKFPPKKINHYYGYRTTRSMKSQEAWDFAQVYGAKKMLWAGWVMLAMGVMLLPLPFSENVKAILSVSTLIIVAVWMIVVTEKALKSKFP
jgi:uncharacterized membrane protein